MCITLSIGDLIQVASGELSNLVARIISINTINKTVTVIPYNSILKGEFSIEMGIILKYIPVGSHVKVSLGQYISIVCRVVYITYIMYNTYYYI